MLKILITIALILILTTSIYSQVDARFGGFGGGGFRGGGLWLEAEVERKALVPILFL